MCHDPHFCGNFQCIGLQKISGIDDAGTGQFFNQCLVDAPDGKKSFFSPLNLKF